MRTYKTVTITKEYEELDEFCCDLCGREGTKRGWERGIYQVNDVTVEVEVHQREGDSYPEGGWGTEYIVDLCPQCFKDRLIPWLRSQGADIKEMEWDW